MGNMVNTLYKQHQVYGSWSGFKSSYYSKHKKDCKLCRSSKNIHLHHKRYKTVDGKSIVGKERSRHVIPLCSGCHRLWHYYHGTRIKLDRNIVKKIREMIFGYGIKDAIRYAPIILGKYDFIRPPGELR